MFMILLFILFIMVNIMILWYRWNKLRLVIVNLTTTSITLTQTLIDILTERRTAAEGGTPTREEIQHLSLVSQGYRLITNVNFLHEKIDLMADKQILMSSKMDMLKDSVDLLMENVEQLIQKMDEQSKMMEKLERTMDLQTHDLARVDVNTIFLVSKLSTGSEAELERLNHIYSTSAS